MIPQLPPNQQQEPPTPPPDKPAASQKFKQLQLSDREKNRLHTRIWADAYGARSNHDRRLQKFERILRMWRGLNVTGGNREDGPDFQVPMIKWVTFAQWARCMQALIGDDAQIIAQPRSPEGDRTSKKVGSYMTWRFFEYMNSLSELAPFLFRAILLGRAHAEVIYEQEYYWERDPKTGIDKEVLCYDAPKMRALWPSQLILPAQDNVQTVSDFAWKIRRNRLTPQQLLDGERRGRYQGIKENYALIVGQAAARQDRDILWDEDRRVSDQAEGVDHAVLEGNHTDVEVWEWYGKWRLPKGKRDAAVDNYDWRQAEESELRVAYLPRPGIVIGVQDLRDVYPRMKKRDPFVDLAMVKDGSYWAPGLGELLEDLQNEDSINFKLFRKAGMLSVGPIILYRPSAGGFNPQVFEYRPNTAIPTEDPQSMQVVYMKADLTYIQAMQQTLKAMAELVTGVSDQTAGLSSDRPNAPRTASGQAMLMQEGNTRASLDMLMLKDDVARLINYVWELDCEYADTQVFFRVTGDDATGLFDTKNGFGTMTSEEREHQYNLSVKFATSIYSREAKKQAILQLYQLSVMNPILMQNPRGLWVMLNRMWEAFGEKDFSDVIPEPPETDRPRTPKEEYQDALSGEDLNVNPLDDDMTHLMDHRKRLEQLLAEPPERQDKQAAHALAEHIVRHEQQRRQKMLMQELITQVAGQLQAQMGPEQPGQAPAQGPPQAPPQIPSAAGPPVAPQMSGMGAPPRPPMGGMSQ